MILPLKFGGITTEQGSARFFFLFILPGITYEPHNCTKSSYFIFPLQLAGLLQATIIPCDLSNVDKISVWNYVEQLGSLLWSTIVNDIDISHPSQSGVACVGHDTSAALEVVFALGARRQSFLRRPFILPHSSRFLLRRNECIAYRWFFNPMIFLICF